MINTIDDKYGKIFKQIRLQKQLPLSYFEKIGIGKSHISKFERGELIMSFDRIHVLLQEMNVTLGEFELIMNNFTQDYQDAFLLEAVRAEFYNNNQKLRKLYMESKEYCNPWLTLLVKARLEGVTNSEISKIMGYLTKVEKWGYFELTFTFSVIEFLNTSDIINLLTLLDLKKRIDYAEIRYKRRYMQVIYRAVGALIKKGEEKLAKLVMETINQNEIGSVDFYISNLKKIYEGMILFCFENDEKGLENIKGGLEIISCLGASSLRKYHERRILNFLNMDSLYVKHSKYIT
jgi:HTH-type transcriptional regulator, SHP2-responsive activator